MIPDSARLTVCRVDRLMRQDHLDNFSEYAYGADQTYRAPEVQPGCPQMITRTDYPDALKEDTPYEFAL